MRSRTIYRPQYAADRKVHRQERLPTHKERGDDYRILEQTQRGRWDVTPWMEWWSVGEDGREAFASRESRHEIARPKAGTSTFGLSKRLSLTWTSRPAAICCSSRHAWAATRKTRRWCRAS